MATSSQSAPTPASAESPISDPEGWYEDEDYAIRAQLGLRRTHYTESPDPRPCPPWCELAGSGELHEVNENRPFNARHTSHEVDVALSLYDGAHVGRGNWQTAHLGAKLVSLGDARPSIRLSRWYGGQSPQHIRNLLTLSVNDATDLLTVLTYLVAQAEASEALGWRI